MVVRGLNGRIRRARPTCARRRRRRRREAGTRAREGAGGDGDGAGTGRERCVRVAWAIVVDVETTAS